MGLGPKDKSLASPLLKTNIAGLSFPNPLGLAPGFDKNAEIIDPIFDLGFGFVEAGGIVPRPQPGNPKPRLFRDTESEAVINRYGLNSEGLEICAQRIEKWHAKRRLSGIFGINLAKNKDSTEVSADFVAGLTRLAPFIDYATMNISSPNTAGLRDLQGRDQLEILLRAVMTARERCAKKPRLFVKIAPDLSEKEIEDIADIALTSGIDGLVVGNTTTSRPPGLSARFGREIGGLSGKPLFELSTKVLGHMYRLTKGRIPLIGCGGVFSGADAYAKIRAGASLVQLYTGLVFEGPGLIPRIKHELAGLLEREGFKSVSEAVGRDHKP
jgi:dihydroorotate dehydrogenase